MICRYFDTGLSVMMLRFVVWTVLGWGALGKPAPSPMKVASVESHNDGKFGYTLEWMELTGFL